MTGYLGEGGLKETGANIQCFRQREKTDKFLGITAGKTILVVTQTKMMTLKMNILSLP